MIRLAEVKLPQASLDNAAEALAKGELSFRTHWVRDFEVAFAEWLGVSHAVACSSGHAAMHLAVLSAPCPAPSPAKRVRAQVKTEIVVPNITYHASAMVVLHAGHTPVFADINPQTWNLDPESLEQAITRRTRAVITVDLLGHPPDHAITEICRRHKLPLIEDACESVGGCGTRDGIAAFSFFANKPLTTGEGGMVVTNDPKVAELARLYRDQGDHSECYEASVEGFNYRFTAIQAAVGLGQIPLLNERFAKRTRLTTRYISHFPAHMTQDSHTSLMFGLRVRNRQAVRASLAMQDIETRVMFPCLSSLKPFRMFPTAPCPESTKLADEGILLPCHENMTLADVDRVCDAVKRAMQ